MVGVGMPTRAMQLEQNDVVQASIRRLKAMGMNVIISPENENEVFVFIDIEDILALIRRNITYQNREVSFRMPYISIYLFR